MARLDKIQRISGVLRYLLLVISAVLWGAIILAMFSPDQGWVMIADGQLGGLWNNGASNRMMLLAIVSPIGVSLILGIYWLQRLFGEYRAGHFFTDENMRCYLWLVWLKLLSFVYGAIWPPLLSKLGSTGVTADAAVSIDAGTFVELVVLLLIVYLLKETQQINDDNQAIV